jgi:5'(3')-deoxyribonucleotidase
MSEMKKKIVYFDMDNVLVNFQSGIDATPIEVQKEYEGQLDNVPGIFSMMKPNAEMVDLFNKLSDDARYDVYILSTSPWDNPTAASDKVEWVKKYLPKAYKRVILSHNKHLNAGDYLIDDRTANGAGEFGGELIQYMSDKFPTVKSIENYLI